MNILDEFFLKFTSNAKDAAKDNEALGKSADNLEKKLKDQGESIKRGHATRAAFKKDIDEAKGSVSGLTGALGDLLITGIGALGAFKIGAEFTQGAKDSISYQAQLGRQAEMTGIAADQMAALDTALVNVGGRKGEALSSLGQITQMLQSMGLPTDQVIGSLRHFSEIMAKMDETGKHTFFQQTGLPQDFYLLLDKGPQAFDEMIAKAQAFNRITQQGTEDAKAFDNIWSQVGNQISGLFNPLTDRFLKYGTYVGQVTSQLLGGDFKGAFNTWGAPPQPPEEKPLNWTDWKAKYLPTWLGGGSAPAPEADGGIHLNGPAPPETLQSFLNNKAVMDGMNRAAGGGASDPFGGDDASRQAALDQLAMAQKHISAADTTGLNSALPGIYGAPNITKALQLGAGAIVIQTPQGASPQDVATAVTDELNRQFRITIGNNDDSVEK